MAPGSFSSEFIPKLLVCLKNGYSRETFTKDLFAGITVAIIALPLAMALAIASGVTPERGLFTAIVAGFLISALGGSRVQIGGPTGAFVVIVYDVVQKHGYEGLATATLMAGVMLVLLGAAKIGSLIKYIPYPVTTGFTTGIALIIFTSQIRDFFGFQIATLPAPFVEKWFSFYEFWDTINITALGIGAGSLLILMLLRKFLPRIPGSIVAVVLAATVVKLLELPVETIGSRFGDIPHTLPVPSFSFFSWAKVPELFPAAITIALLSAIESLLSAVVADGMTGFRHRSNCELVGQGVANFCSPIFGGIPATGAIARTAANVKSGAITPVAGIIHAIAILVVMLVLAPWASLIPLPTLAAILFVVAWNMAELDRFRDLLRTPRSDVAVLLTSFLLTVLVNLTVAVEVGVVMAALLFMRRMSEVTNALTVTPIIDGNGEASNEEEPNSLPAEEVPAGVEVFEMNGPFFFGVVDRLKHVLDGVASPPKVFILRMSKVPVIDATGIFALEELHLKCVRQGGVLMLSGVQEPVKKALTQAGLVQKIGRDNLCRDIRDALKRARNIIAG